MLVEPRDLKLYSLVSAVVSEGITLLRRRIADGDYIPNYHPTLERSALPGSELPTFSERRFAGKPDYSAVFGNLSTSPIRIEGIPSFDALKSYVLSHERFKVHYELDRIAALDPRFRNLLEDLVGYRIATELIEMYQTAYPDLPFESGKLLPFYCALEEQVFADPLPVEFVIPILFLKFEDTDFSISDTIAIRAIPDYLAYGLAISRFFGMSTHRIVSGAATHAVFIARDHRNTISHSGAFSQGEIDYPVDHVEDVFSALRVALGHHIGYAQIGMEQTSWKQLRYANASKSLTSRLFRKYPEFFEDGYWLQEPPTATHEDLLRVRALVSGAFTSNRHLKVAKRRINDCSLRERPDDATIDALIGLESLLSDGQPTELTHKLSLRTAALLARHGREPVQAKEVFGRIKDVYTYRSKVVHGDDAAKVVKTKFDGVDWGPAQEALRYLREVVMVLSNHPRFCDPHAIDHELLLGAATPK